MATPAFPLPLRPVRRALFAVLALSLVGIAPGCGGGGGSAATPPAPAPTGLAYPTNPAVYIKGTPIGVNTPTVTSTSALTFSVTPPLPAGLALNTTTGAVSGTPSAVTATAIFLVRATNAGGSATANLSVTVNDLAPAFAYSSTSVLFGKDVAITSMTPTSTGGTITGWAVAPALPAGLAFSTSSGMISGTPTVGAASQAYTVTATNSGGSLAKVLTLAVATAAPTIASFQASPTTVPMGSPTTLSWSLTGDPASALSIDGASVLGGLSASVTPSRRQTYTLEATNLKGTSQATATVAARGLDYFVGNVDGPGWMDGTGSAARFNQPQGVVADPVGNLYVSDYANHTIRKVSPAGVVTTLAGTPGLSDKSDGTPGGFWFPSGLAIDGSGNLYVADSRNNAIRKINPAGAVTTLAGDPYASAGSVDGTGTAARFRNPMAVSVTATGDVIVVDTYNHTLRKVTTAGVVTTLAGSAGLSGSADGTGAQARFAYPGGVVAHPDGNIYVTDLVNHTVRKVTSAGVVTTLAGSAGLSGSADGTAGAARFFNPRGLTVDGAGDLWLSDVSNQTLRKITTAGVVTTMAGSVSTPGWVDGSPLSARLNTPAGLALLPSGRLAIADEYNHAVRLMDVAQGLSTFAGAPPQLGSADGFGASARFTDPASIVVDASGNAFVADYGNSNIRKITPAGITTTLAGTAGLSGPTGLAMDGAGNLLIADSSNHTLLKLTPAGVMSTLAGLSGTSGSSDGAGAAARFFFPSKLAVDGSGNIYVSDSGNNTIRKVTPAGVVTTLAGLAGAAGFADGNGSSARFNMPSGLALDGSGNLFVGDLNNFKIRRITPAGDVTTLVLTRYIYGPASLCFDGAGLLYMADAWGHAIYTIDTTTGNTTLLIGTSNLPGAFPGPFPAGLNSPTGLAFTPQGDLLITTANGVMLATAP